MEFLSVLGFAFALSLDGFGAGIAYGIRNIRIPIYCLLLINLTSSAVLAMAMVGGHILASNVNNSFAQWIGASILIAVGIWTIFQTWQHQNDDKKNPGNKINASETNKKQKVLEVKIKLLGFVIQILREPVKADIDASGFLSVQESLLLGIALAMDAMGAGFGLALSGFKPWFAPLIVGMAQFIMVSSGVYLGGKFGAGWLGKKVALLPGWILIAIGISRVIKFL